MFIHSDTHIHAFTEWAYSHFNILKHTKTLHIYSHKGKCSHNCTSLFSITHTKLLRHSWAQEDINTIKQTYWHIHSHELAHRLIRIYRHTRIHSQLHLTLFVVLTYMNLLTHSAAHRENNYTLIASHTPTCSYINLYIWTCSLTCTCSHTQIWMNTQIHLNTNTNFRTFTLTCSKQKRVQTSFRICSCSNTQVYSDIHPHVNVLKH